MTSMFVVVVVAGTCRHPSLWQCLFPTDVDSYSCRESKKNLLAFDEEEPLTMCHHRHPVGPLLILISLPTGLKILKQFGMRRIE